MNESSEEEIGNRKIRANFAINRELFIYAARFTRITMVSMARDPNVKGCTLIP
jgi:hypothetical protein